MFNFTSSQDLLIKMLAINSYQTKFGDHGFTPGDFSTRVDKPNHASVCSVYITSNRTDDKFRMKLYITEIGTTSGVGLFYMTVEENYGSGNLDDEIFVAEAKLAQEEFASLSRYLASADFIDNVLNADNHIGSEDGNDRFVAEDNVSLFAFEY